MPTLRHLACQRRKLLLMSCCLHGSMSPLTSALCRTGTMLRRKSWGVSLAPLCLLCRLEIFLESWMLAQVPSHYFSLWCFSKVWLELLLFYCGLGLYHLNQSRSIQQSENNDIIIFWKSFVIGSTSQPNKEQVEERQQWKLFIASCQETCSDDFLWNKSTWRHTDLVLCPFPHQTLELRLPTFNWSWVMSSSW